MSELSRQGTILTTSQVTLVATETSTGTILITGNKLYIFFINFIDIFVYFNFILLASVTSLYLSASIAAAVSTLSVTNAVQAVFSPAAVVSTAAVNTSNKKKKKV